MERAEAEAGWTIVRGVNFFLMKYDLRVDTGRVVSCILSGSDQFFTAIFLFRFHTIILTNKTIKFSYL